jgi:hypothetical protein
LINRPLNSGGYGAIYRVVSARSAVAAAIQSTDGALCCIRLSKNARLVGNRREAFLNGFPPRLKGFRGRPHQPHIGAHAP